MKRRRFPVTRILASVILACATTVAVAWGLALWAPIAQGRGIVSVDGDHLQPWILRVDRPGAERFIYFEKGRVYSKRNVGPPMASSSAVACWSFATSTRTNPRFARGSLTVPVELEAEMARQPRTAWGVAHDTRGWPFPALACTFIGTTATDALHVYDIRDGVRIEPQQSVSLPGGMGGVSLARTAATFVVNESLADVRALPTQPLASGFVLNTLLAGAAWFGTLTAGSLLVAGIKARVRKPAGHCPKCNYDLRGDLASGCPECGWNRSDKPKPA